MTRSPALRPTKRNISDQYIVAALYDPLALCYIRRGLEAHRASHRARILHLENGAGTEKSKNIQEPQNADDHDRIQD